jgi:glycosyltransferase involved in cell wall biosynthesis
MTPELSVVVPSVNGLPILLECLAALRADAEASKVRTEVIVVERCGETVRCEVARRFSEVRLLPVAADTTIPRMRQAAFEAATGSVVGVIEDHVIVPPGWARQMLDALAAGAEVVGGSVRNAATDTTTDWAAFLCEYSHLLPPLPSGDVESLTGNNVVYRRALLARYRAVIAEGRWEDHLHASMRRDGVRLTCRPEIVVGHKMHYRVRDYVSQRYLYSRAYAGIRAAQLAAPKRAVLSLATAALPPVLFYRIVSRVAARRAHRVELVRSLPLLFLFVCAWAAGEAIGYAAGPGDALARVT